MFAEGSTFPIFDPSLPFGKPWVADGLLQWKACLEFRIHVPVSGHRNQRELEAARTLLHTTWNHFKESGLALPSSCQLPGLSSFICGVHTKGKGNDGISFNCGT